MQPNLSNITPTSGSLNPNPFAHITARDLEQFDFSSGKNILSCAQYRQIIAQRRWEFFKEKGYALQFSPSLSTGVWPDTIPYNLKGLENSIIDLPSLERSELVFRPVMSMDRIYSYQRLSVFPYISVLLIGCRTEYEVLMALGYGVDPANLKALDLISYSPWITPGDMHALPFADNSFDVVIMGWVISYTKEPQQVASEVTRVAKPRCVVSIGADSARPDDAARVAFYADRPRDTQGILNFFGSNVGQVIYRNEPNYPMDLYPIEGNPSFEGNIITTFEIKK